MKKDDIKLMVRLVVRDFDQAKKNKIERVLANTLQEFDEKGYVRIFREEEGYKSPDNTDCIFALYASQKISIKDFIKKFDVFWFYNDSDTRLVGDPYRTVVFEDETAIWASNTHPDQRLIIPEIVWAHIYTWDTRERRQKELEKIWQKGTDYASIELKHPNETKFLIRIVVEEDNALLSNEIIAAININPKLEQLDEAAKVEFISSEPYTIQSSVNVLTLAFLSKKDISIKEFIEVFGNVTWYYQIRQSFNVHDPDKIHFDVEDAEWSKMLSHEGEEFLIPEIEWVHCFSWDWKRRREEALTKNL